MFSCVHRCIRYLLAIGFPGLLVACAVHPLPEDVGGVPTTDIVKSVRCETLAGLDSLTPEERAKAEPIIKATVIGYHFRFDINEENDLAGAGPKNSFLTLANGSKFIGNVSGHANLHRENLRTFVVIEPLSDMLNTKNRAICNDRSVQQNWIYPIAGRIGLDEVTRTYLRLEMLSELAKSPVTVEKNIVFSDDLTFTTQFDAGAVDTLAVDAVVGKLRVTKSSLKAAAYRHDTHKVIVALTRKTIDVDEARVRSPDQKSSLGQAQRALFLANDNIRDPRAQALLIQVDERARTRVAIELHRRRSLNDPDHLPAQALGQRLIDVLKLP